MTATARRGHGEGRGQVLGEVLQVIGQVLSGGGAVVGVVDLVDFTDCRESQMASDLR
jgi:hypothetical protein